ncbi:hypothetical protein ABZP36_021673 [Zizania latifolia]
MAWWRARVVAPVRRAWLAAAAAARARARNGECGILSLHQDVQTCGYHDVQVMWNMLSSEKEATAGVRSRSSSSRSVRSGGCRSGRRAAGACSSVDRTLLPFAASWRDRSISSPASAVETLQQCTKAAHI